MTDREELENAIRIEEVEIVEAPRPNWCRHRVGPLYCNRERKYDAHLPDCRPHHDCGYEPSLTTKLVRLVGRRKPILTKKRKGSPW